MSLTLTVTSPPGPTIGAVFTNIQQQLTLLLRMTTMTEYPSALCQQLLV